MFVNTTGFYYESDLICILLEAHRLALKYTCLIQTKIKEVYQPPLWFSKVLCQLTEPTSLLKEPEK